MTIWAIADLHLAKGVPSKHMRLFGPRWEHYMEQIEAEWRRVVSVDDLVLIPGDISWAMHLQEAAVDLAWIDALPGTKLLLRGNHDYWWQSLSKVKQILPPSCHLLQNNAFYWEKEGVAIGGSRLWDAPQISFATAMPKDIPLPTSPKEHAEESEKIYTRELLRLETSLKQLSPKASRRIAITHYPPVGPALETTPASHLLEKYGIEQCLFGHLHGIDPHQTLFGTLHGVQYHLVAADALPNFTPYCLSYNSRENISDIKNIDY